MPEMLNLPFIGIELYCPDCHRKLVSFNDDGTVNLAGKTALRGRGEARIDDGEVEMPEDIVVMEATCYRRPCRIKRYLRERTSTQRRTQ